MYTPTLAHLHPHPHNSTQYFIAENALMSCLFVTYVSLVQDVCSIFSVALNILYHAS